MSEQRRPWRRCSSCFGVCHWHDEAWVCNQCGDEWYPDHASRYEPPELTTIKFLEDHQGDL